MKQLQLTNSENEAFDQAKTKRYLLVMENHGYLLSIKYENYCIQKSIPFISIRLEINNREECPFLEKHAHISYSVWGLGASLTSNCFQQVLQAFDNIRLENIQTYQPQLSPYGGNGVVSFEESETFAINLYNLLSQPEALINGAANYWPAHFMKME